MYITIVKTELPELEVQIIQISFNWYQRNQGHEGCASEDANFMAFFIFILAEQK
jgi:hypothetical protein